jgi:hypothetical protein
MIGTAIVTLEHVSAECVDLPEVEHTVDAGELGSIEVTVDLESYEDEIVECVTLIEAGITSEEVVRAFREARELESLFSELVRQCGVVEMERAFKASL